MPFPLLAIGLTKLVSTAAGAAQSIQSTRNSGRQNIKRAIDAFGAKTTNSIASAFDLNRWAFASGTIPLSVFKENYRLLWGHLQDAATKVSQADPEYGRRMIADRDYGGKFGNVWKGTYHDELLEQFQGKLDAEGYVLPDFQWPWPEKGQFSEIAPLEGFETPRLPPGGIAGSHGSSMPKAGMLGALALISVIGLGLVIAFR